MSLGSVLLIQFLTNMGPVFETELSDRLHRVAIQQAAGIAKSWRTNRENAYQAYLQDVVDYVQAKARAEAEDRMSAFKRKEPIWNDWNVPVLRVPVIQANANVVVVEPSKESTFDYWLRVSTLDKGAPLRIPVKLAPYHKAVLKDRASIRPRPSTSARGSGGLRSHLTRTFLFKLSRLPQWSVWTWALPISSQPPHTKNMAVFTAKWPGSVGAIAKNVGARRSCGHAWRRKACPRTSFLRRAVQPHSA